MPYPVPRKATRLDGRRMLTNLLCFAVAMAAMFGCYILLPLPDVWRFIIMIPLSIIVMLTLLSVQNKWLENYRVQRYQRIERQLLSLGYECISRPSENLMAMFYDRFRPLEAWLGLPRGEAGIRWLGTIPHEAGEVLLMEYLFQTGSHRSVQEHNFSIAAWPYTRTDLPGAALAALGGCAFYRRRLIDWRFRKTRLRGEPFDDMQNRWILEGTADTARAFLTPAVKAELARSPKGERWHIGGGLAICLYTEPMDADQWPVFLRRAEGILSLAGR